MQRRTPASYPVWKYLKYRNPSKSNSNNSCLHSCLTKNPVDMTFSLDPKIYRDCIDLIAGEDAIDGLIITITSHLAVQEELANTIVKSFVTSRKPLLVSWTTSRLADPARGILRRSGVPVYSTPEHAARAMACLVAYSRSVRE